MLAVTLVMVAVKCSAALNAPYPAAKHYEAALLPQTQTARETSGVKEQQGRYIPQSNLLFCVCMKCGSTSLFHHIFHLSFGQTWCEFASTQPDLPSQDMSCPNGKETELDPTAASRKQQDGLIQLSNVTHSGKYHGIELYTHDSSEFIDRPFWQGIFDKGTSHPVDLWSDGKTSTYAFVREPVSRLISGWVDKLSCGVYSVGDDPNDPSEWQRVRGNRSHAKPLWEFDPVKGRRVEATYTYSCPCPQPHHFRMDFYLSEHQKNIDCAAGQMTTCEAPRDSCMPLEVFADVIEHVYADWEWGEDAEHDAKVKEASRGKEPINVHFRPQTGRYSCFEHVRPEDYGTVTTIDNVQKLNEFSSHLLTSKGDGDAPSFPHANTGGGALYFAGEPLVVSDAVKKKLHDATWHDRKILGPYLSDS